MGQKKRRCVWKRCKPAGDRAKIDYPVRYPFLKMRFATNEAAVRQWLVEDATLSECFFKMTRDRCPLSSMHDEEWIESWQSWFANGVESSVSYSFG